MRAAAVCRFCRADLKNPTIKSNGLSLGASIAAACVVLVLVAAAGIAWKSSRGVSPSRDRSAPAVIDWRTQDNSHAAYLMMTRFVTKTLKAPSTAEFGSIGDEGVGVAKTGTDYIIIGWVDAENTFGANLRSEFSGAVRQVGEDEWQLVQLTFEGKEVFNLQDAK